MVSYIAKADMNAANPQAAAFRVVDKGTTAQGGDLLLPIPILSVPGRNGLGGSISLVYSSSDNTLRKESTDVGFGFGLGAASAITRSVNGVPDDYIDINYRTDFGCTNNQKTIKETGYLHPKPINDAEHFSEKDIPTTSQCSLLGVNRGNPDTFYVAINGQGTSMMLDQDNVFRFSNVKPWKVDYQYNSNGITKFTVTTEDGTKYVFKDLGFLTYTRTSTCDTLPRTLEPGEPTCANYDCGLNCNIVQTNPSNSQGQGNGYVYAWPLVSILSHDYIDSNNNGYPDINDKGSWVKFDYFNTDYIGNQNSDAWAKNYRVFDPTYARDFITLNEAKINSFSYIKHYYLSTITTPLYKADLTYNPRTSTYDSSQPNLYKLDYVTLKQNPDLVVNAPVLKTIKLTYATLTNRLNGKLTLKEIQEFRDLNNNNIVDADEEFLPPIKFDYNNPSTCSENKFGLCDSDITAYLLNSITYPTGGRVEYVYEPDIISYLQDQRVLDTSSESFFLNSGTRVKEIRSYDGTGKVTRTYFQYYRGVTESNPFCQKKYDAGIPGIENPSSFVICPLSGDPTNYVYLDSDIGKSNVNSVSYSIVKSWVDPKVTNGVTMTFYTTSRDYPSLCSGNGNCLTSLDYQSGRIVKARDYKGDDFTLIRESFKKYSLDDKDLIGVNYNTWLSSSQHAYKIKLRDWDHLDEQDGAKIVNPREVPEPIDEYSFVSSGTFIEKEQLAENGKLISVRDYIYLQDSNYHDIPGQLNNNNQIQSQPGFYFNGLPKITREHLLNEQSTGPGVDGTGCRTSMLLIPALDIDEDPGGSYYVSYYTCDSLKTKETTNTYGFQTNPNLNLRNMKIQLGSVSVKDVESPGSGSGSGKLVSQATTFWLPSNSNNQQFYPAFTSSWIDRNNNYVIDTGESIVTNFDSYDEYGNNLETTDPRYTVTYTRFDGLFNNYPEKTWNSVLGSQTNPVLLNTYDELGNLKTATNFNGKITTYNYDGLGRLKSVKKPLDIDPSQSINYYYAYDTISINNLNYVETIGILDSDTLISARSYADGQGKNTQSAIIESATSTIRTENNYYDSGLLKNSFKPIRDIGTGTSGTLNLFNNPSTELTTSIPLTGNPSDPLPDDEEPGLKQPGRKIPAPGPTIGFPGYIYVTSSPSEADVYFDTYATPLGKTPMLITNVAAGTHTITARKTGYQDASTPVDVVGGQTSYVDFVLVPQTGNIYVTATDGATGSAVNAYISVDNTYRGQSPLLVENLIVSNLVGNHIVKASWYGYIVTEQPVNVVPGTTNVNIQLPPSGTGFVSVTSTPTAANIYLDGALKGISPITINTQAGVHEIIVVKNGYETIVQDIEVRSGQTNYVNANMAQKSGTAYSYTKDPILRLKNAINPDSTIVKNEYRIEKEATQVQICGVTNSRRCTGTSSGFVSTGSLGFNDVMCRTDTTNGCPVLLNNNIDTDPNNDIICQYSCTGTSSQEGCPGSSISGSVLCTNVDYTTTFYNGFNGCNCGFYAYSEDYYGDGALTTTNVERELLVVKTFDENNMDDPIKGITETYTDRFGNLIKFKDSLNQITSYEYDILGRLLKVTNANNQVTNNKYDSLGRLFETSNPDFGTITYRYDDNGNLIEKNQNSAITTYHYDGLNRLVTAIYPNNEPQVIYTYDNGNGCTYTPNPKFNLFAANSKGRLCSIYNGVVKKEFKYDDRGRLKIELDTINSKQYVKDYVYDSQDNIVRITDPKSLQVDYQFNNLNQVEKVIVNNKETNIAYNPEGTLKEIRYPNLVVASYTYTPRDFMESFNIQNFKENNVVKNLQEQLAYDKSGNVKTITELSNSLQPKVEFEYDSLYRLTRAFNPSQSSPGKYYDTFSYTYDSIGNRKNENNFNYQYPNAPNPATNNKLQQVKNSYNTIITDFTYTIDGNLQSKTYNREYGICNVAIGTVNDGKLVVAFNDNNLAVGTPVRVIYDSYSTNNHYEWSSSLQTNTENINCYGTAASKIMFISPSNLQAQKSDTQANSNSWYNSLKEVAKFKAYNPVRQTDNYYYDSQNRLTKIEFDYASGNCANYYYDEAGLRVKKIESNQATVYMYNANNPVYEETFAENQQCAIKTKCSDGTSPSTCSYNKPLYCDANKNLVNNCGVCGCPAPPAGYQATCQSSGACVNEEIPPGGDTLD